MKTRDIGVVGMMRTDLTDLSHETVPSNEFPRYDGR
jgi:hypothetical protein